MRKMIVWCSAKFLGLAVCSAYLALVIAEGLDGLYQNVNPWIYPFLLMMAVSITGYAISWHSEKRGGELMIAGGSAMLIFHLFRQDLFSGLAYGLPFIIVGILSIVSTYNQNAKSRDF